MPGRNAFCLICQENSFKIGMEIRMEMRQRMLAIFACHFIKFDEKA